MSFEFAYFKVLSYNILFFCVLFCFYIFILQDFLSVKNSETAEAMNLK